MNLRKCNGVPVISFVFVGADVAISASRISAVFELAVRNCRQTGLNILLWKPCCESKHFSEFPMSCWMLSKVSINYWLPRHFSCQTGNGKSPSATGFGLVFPNANPSSIIVYPLGAPWLVVTPFQKLFRSKWEVILTLVKNIITYLSVSLSNRFVARASSSWTPSRKSLPFNSLYQRLI